MRSLYVTTVYILFLAFGLAAPFVLSLGYVWVDTFDPQAIAGDLLGEVPVSLIMGAAAIAAFLAFDQRKGRLTLTSILLIAFAIWITLTTMFLAEIPAQAWYKWNYAFKTVCFAAFLPFVFRSRIQIEAFLQIYLFSLMVHFLPVGLKTFISGGGYGRELGILSGNSLLAEGSTLSAVVLMLVPIILCLRRHTLLLPRTRLVRLAYLALAVIAIAAAIGTYERTALIGMAVVAIGLWLRSRRKILFGTIGACALALAVSFSAGAWSDRISTVKDFNSEGSALGRILVWKWTLGYVAQHPLGGGFNVYMIDRVEFPPVEPGAAPLVVVGKAFHSVYFELLGEQGVPGLALFLTLVGVTMMRLQGVVRMAKGRHDLLWARDTAFALQVGLATILACGSFVGIAFQPMIYNLLAISAALHAHTKRCCVPAAVAASEEKLFLPGIGARPKAVGGDLF